MPWIPPLKANMDISLNIVEAKSNCCLIALAQKISIYTIAPLALIAIFESLIKNFLFINLTNIAISVLNTSYDICIGSEN
jgi:hypothetical protein